jgi:peptidoglycan/LPS O-acetylase OafA/YrhL
MVETPRGSITPHLAVLDGLRGIAILVVLWYHVWEWTWLAPRITLFGHELNFQFINETGFSGVDLFYFISGFVLFYPYARHVFEGKPLQTLAHYVYRRFIKIVPSYYLQLLIVTPWIVGAFTGTALLWQYVTHLTFTHIWFHDTYGAINGVLWTLAVEVQFYVIFPALSWCFRRWPLLTFLGMVAVANAYRLLMGQHHMDDYVLMTQMPGFLDLFACGMLAAWLYVMLRSRMPDVGRRQWAFTLVAIAGFAIYGMLLKTAFNMRLIPAWQQVWSNGHLTALGLSFVVLTVGSCLGLAWWRGLIANPVFVFFSVISYNLYLWHQLIANFLGRHNIPSPRSEHFVDDRAWQWSFTIVAALVSIAVASLITYAFERPLLARGFRAVTDLFDRRGKTMTPAAKTVQP